MARRKRFNIPRVPQHVVHRGNNRQATFIQERDYSFYLECLAESAARHGCELHAYVLMDNHVHLLATPHKSDGVSRMMQSLGRRYVQYFNYTYRRSGALWEGRHKTCLVGEERYLLTCYRYIELNPVRIGMVKHPADYRWSSYCHHAQGRPDPLIRDHAQYLALGVSDQERHAAYRALFRDEIEPELVDEVRGAARKGLIIGSERFRTEIEAKLKRKVGTGKRGRPRGTATTSNARSCR